MGGNHPAGFARLSRRNVGTDIHFYVERKVNGKWVTCDTWNPQYREWDPDHPGIPPEKRFYDNRNYDLFDILARGRTGENSELVPISEPRGIPDDICPEIQRELYYYEHTGSWLLLKELLDYD